MLPLLLSLAVVILLAYLLNRYPQPGLPLLIATLPFERIGSYDATLVGSSLTIRPSQLIGAALIILSLWRWRGFRIHRFEWLPPLYLMAGLVSLTTAGSLKRGALVLLFSTFVWLLYLTVRRLATEANWGLLERVLWWTTFLAVLFGLYQFVGDTLGVSVQLTGLKTWYTKAVFGFPRIQSFSFEPLYLANFLLIPFAFFSVRFIQRRDRRSGVLIFLLALTITLTLSRGGYVAALIVITTVGAALRNWRGLLALGSTVLLGVILGLGLISGASLWQQGSLKRVQTFTHQATNVETGSSVSERSQWRRQAIQAFESHPLTGIGIGNFGVWAHRHDRTSPETAIVNNEPLELLAETGIVGFAAITAFLTALLARSWRAYRSGRGSEEERAWLIGLSAAAIGFAVQYQTFSTLYITYIWVALGLLVAVQDRILSPAPAKPSSRKKAPA